MSAGAFRVSLAAITVAAVLAAGLSTAAGRAGSAAISDRAMTGVVVVTTRLAYGGGGGSGTGVVLTSSGNVLTNNHVIRGAGAILVNDVSSGKTYSATVAGYSVSKDIALLRLRDATGLQTVRTGNSNTVRVGDAVTAVGNGGGVMTLKRGTVTGLRQAISIPEADGPVRLTGLIETSARLVPGDSGGPLLSSGLVVGIDAATSGSFGQPGSDRQGYAIPINVALSIARQVETGRSTPRVHVGPTAFLGVAVGRPPSDATRGAVVERVVSGSPASSAGLAANDLIVAFDGKRVTSPAHLKALILQAAPRQRVQIAWIDPRAGRTSAVTRLVAGPPQ